MGQINGAETIAKAETKPQRKMIAYWAADAIWGKHRVSDESWLPAIHLDHSRDLKSAWSHCSRHPRFPSA